VDIGSSDRLARADHAIGYPASSGLHEEGGTVSEETGTASEETGTASAHEELPPLEDAGTPGAKHGDVPEGAADEQIRGEWQRAGEMQQESDHLREVLEDARQAVARASDADSMESGGIGVRPEDVQDFGSGDAEESDENEAKDEHERMRS
jgi:hypothetical protein